MRRIRVFGKRTMQEVIRDPLSLGFGLGFPLVVLLLMSMIQRSIPVSLFEAEQLTPGILVFGQSFFCLFTATLVAKDRSESLMARLRATPMQSHDFFFGYLLPLIPVSLLQSTIVCAAALLMGLKWKLNVLLLIIAQLPITVFYLSFGIFFGCLLNERQVGGICGALVTNLSAWLSGAWFDLKLIGGGFERAAFCLPFANATEVGRLILQCNTDGIVRAMAIVFAYSIGSVVLAWLASNKMTKEG